MVIDLLIEVLQYIILSSAVSTSEICVRVERKLPLKKREYTGGGDGSAKRRRASSFLLPLSKRLVRNTTRIIKRLVWDQQRGNIIMNKTKRCNGLFEISNDRKPTPSKRPTKTGLVLRTCSGGIYRPGF